jgi:hypothetical protein
MITVDELKVEANKDPTANPFRVSMLYGEFGKRKTTTACSMVKDKGLLLSVDGSWKVLLNNRHTELYEKIKVIELEGLSQLEYIDYSGYDTVIWDPVSTSVAHYLDLLYDESNWGGKYREKIVTTSKELKGLEILAPVDYRVTRDGFRPSLSRLFQLPAHIIFTSHATDPIPGLSKDPQAKPKMPGATFEIMGERADIIANLRPGAPGKFVADMTESSLSFLGKSRIEGLQGKMDLDAFVAKYKEIVFA